MRFYEKIESNDSIRNQTEIIRLSSVISTLEKYTDHVLVHTGQNYDYELNQVFFDELGVSKPDHFLNVDTSSLGKVLGEILIKTEEVILKEKPDAFLVLGDTNSAVSLMMAKRMKIPTYHMEAGTVLLTLMCRKKPTASLSIILLISIWFILNTPGGIC